MPPALDTQDQWNSDQFRLLLDALTDYAIFLLDSDGNVVKSSIGAHKMFGYAAEEFQGKHISCFYSPKDKDSLKPKHELQMASGHGRYEDTSCRIRRDGTQFWANSMICPLRSADGQLRGFSLIIRDVTERRKTEETLRQKEKELFQARKMEAIGRLAGGVAHDFNNFITGIMGLTQDILESMESRDSRRSDLEEIIRTADRARALTRELMAFGRRQAVRPEVINLNDVLSDKHIMLTRLLRTDIKLQNSLDPDIGNIQIDPTQLDQILINLIMNAQDAMPQGGCIHISSSRVAVENDNARGIPEGRYVAFCVSDTGCGMDAAIIARLFEPFFTTKVFGKGTGLGLATVYGIVKQNFGDISVESVPGKGASFRVLLPEIDEPVKFKTAPVAETILTARSETVLIVEDEDIVRRVASRALEKCGYTVLTACSGDQALDLARHYAKPIHLLLTDVIMPGISGRVLAEQFLASRPEVMVLYMSAHAEDVILQRGMLEDGIAFIEKPFTGESLCSKAAAVLAGRAASLSSSKQ